MKGINIMSEGVQTAGSVADEAGLKFETFAAMVGKISEVTRQEGGQIGNGMKTIMARISRSKSADEDVTDEERSNASKAYGAIGISLYDEQGAYQDLNVTLDQLASKWNTLTDAERNFIAEQSAGIRNINTFNAMMKTYADSKELAGEAVSDTGFIDETQAKYLDSMQGKLNQLRASVQEFWNSLLDTGIINAGIEVLTQVVNTGESIVGIFTGISDSVGGTTGKFVSLAAAITSAAIAYKTFSAVKSGDTILGGIKSVGKGGLSGITSIFTGIAGLANKDKRSTLFDGLKKAAGDGNKFTRDGGKLSEAFGARQSGVKGLAEGFGALAGKIGISTKALAGFGVAGAVIGVAAFAFDKLTTSSAEAAEAVAKANEKYQESQQTLKANKSTIDEVAPEFEKLSAGVSADGITNISLTADEFERYHEICNQIAEMYPSLIASYDSQGNAILNLKDGVKSLNDEYEKQVLLASQTRLKEDSGDYIEDFNGKMDKRSWGTKAADFAGDWGTAERGGRVTDKQVQTALKEIQGMSYDDVVALIRAQGITKDKDGKMVKKVDDDTMSYLKGDKIGLSANMSKEEFGIAQKNIQSEMADINNEIAEATGNVKSLMSDYLNTLTIGDDAEFKDADDTIVTMVSSFMSKLNGDFVSGLEEEGVDLQVSLNNFTHDLMAGINESPEAQSSLSNILGINKDTGLDEMESILTNDIKTLADKIGKDPQEIKVALGFEDEGKLIEQYDSVVDNISKKMHNEGKSVLDELSKAENSPGKNVDLNRKQISADKIDSAGWDSKGESSAYMSQVINGKDKSFVVTPILPDGSVLSPDEFNKYVNETILKGGEDVKGITLAAFDKKTTKDATKQANIFAQKLNRASDYGADLGVDIGRVKDFIEDNNIATEEQLRLLEDCYNETGNWADAMNEFASKGISLEVDDEQLKKLEANLKVVEEDLNNIQKATDDSRTSLGLSADDIDNVVKAFSGLDGYDYDELFESTAEGVHLNSSALEKLNGQYETMNKAKYTDQLEKLQDEYARTCAKIEDMDTVTEKSAEINKRNDLEKRIKECQELQARYEGLTNSVSKWQRASSGAEEGDVYDSITKGKDSAKDLYDKGLTGTDEFESFTQMLTNKDMTGSSNLEYIQMYEKQIQSVGKYFTEGADGCQMFLEDLQKVGYASKDASGGWTVTGADIEDMADSLGMSEAAINEIFKKLKDYGGDFDFTEETDYLKGFREEAEKANESFGGFEDYSKAFNMSGKDLHDAGFDNDFIKDFQELKDFKFDLSVTNKGDLQDQIDDAKDLRKVLVAAYGKGSDEVKEFDKQLDYLKAKAGKTEEALNFDINYKKDAKQLDSMVDTLHDMDEYKDLVINFETTSVTNVDNQLDSVSEKLSKLAKGDDGLIDLSAPGAIELVEIFNALINKKNEMEKPAIAKLDVEDFHDNQKQVIQGIKDYRDAVEKFNSTELNVKVGAAPESDLTEAKGKLDAQIGNLKSLFEKDETKEIMTKLGIDPTGTQAEIDTALAGIDSTMMLNSGWELSEEGLAAMGEATKDQNVTVTADITDAQSKLNSVVTQANAATPTITFSQHGLGGIESRINALAGDKYSNIYITKHESTASKANGTAHANGTAFAGGTGGDWGAKEDSTALVGELGTEIRVRDGKWEAIGTKGAGFADVKKGDIIFNHQQASELLKNGYVTSGGGRGKAFIDGTVSKLNSLLRIGSGDSYVSGSFGGGIHFGQSGSGSQMWGGSSSGNTHTNTGSRSNNTKDEKPKESDFDWIERAIANVERAIQRLDVVANSAYKSFSKRNSTLVDEFSKVSDEINLQQQAYNAYMREANSLGLSYGYISKIQSGQLNIETIIDNEDLVDKINKYQEL